MARSKRSPKYPFISLRKALERAEKLYKAENSNYASMAVVMGHWGFKAKSSGGIQTNAALRGYGLLEATRSGAARAVRITERARRILLDNRPDSVEKQELIKEAALEPAMFAELYGKWNKGMPSIPSMRHVLVFEYHFSENGADGFINVFLETIRFAGLTELGNEEESSLEPGEQSLTIDQVSLEQNHVSLTMRKHQLEESMQQATFPLLEGDAVIQWPKSLSADSYDEFEAWVQLTLRRAKRSINESMENTHVGENEQE